MAVLVAAGIQYPYRVQQGDLEILQVFRHRKDQMAALEQQMQFPYVQAAAVVALQPLVQMRLQQLVEMVAQEPLQRFLVRLLLMLVAAAEE